GIGSASKSSPSLPHLLGEEDQDTQLLHFEAVEKHTLATGLEKRSELSLEFGRTLPADDSRLDPAQLDRPPDRVSRHAHSPALIAPAAQPSGRASSSKPPAARTSPSSSASSSTRTANQTPRSA